MNRFAGCFEIDPRIRRKLDAIPAVKPESSAADGATDLGEQRAKVLRDRGGRGRRPDRLDELVASDDAIAIRDEVDEDQPSLAAGQRVLDPATHEVARGGENVSLTATEFRLLEFLMRRAGRVASRSAIIEAVWGFEASRMGTAINRASSAT